MEHLNAQNHLGKGKPNPMGMAATFSLITACGLLLVASGHAGARLGRPWAVTVYWVGLLVIYAPTAFRIAMPRTSRRERIIILMMLGLACYLVKVLHSPLSFTYYDEFIHLRTANDMIQTGHLFNDHPILPVSPFFPGLENVIVCSVELTGLSVFQTAIISLAIARLLLILSLYLFYEQTSNSSWISSLATLLYAANPSFVYLDSQYAYETLALPLLFFTLYAVARIIRSDQQHKWGLWTIIAMGIFSVVMTHHITSYAMVAILSIWAITPLFFDVGNEIIIWYAGIQSFRKTVSSAGGYMWQFLKSHVLRSRWHGVVVPSSFALLSLGLVLLWLFKIAPDTTDYILPTVRGSFTEVFNLIAAESQSRQLFTSSSGETAPLLEQVTGMASVIIILLGLPFSLLTIWKQHRKNLLILGLAGLAVMYPVTLGFRLTPVGADVSGRAGAFLFYGVAIVLAIGTARYLSDGSNRLLRQVAFTSLASIVFAGSIIAGWPPTERLPGPYLVSAMGRSVNVQSVATARWALATLGPENRFAVDRSNGVLIASYGGQRIILPPAERINVTSLYFSEEFAAKEYALLDKADVQYILVDYRLSTGLPRRGTYFEYREPDAGQHHTPIDLTLLKKFDQIPGLSRIYDAGDIVIFVVEE